MNGKNPLMDLVKDGLLGTSSPSSPVAVTVMNASGTQAIPSVVMFSDKDRRLFTDIRKSLFSILDTISPIFERQKRLLETASSNVPNNQQLNPLSVVSLSKTDSENISSFAGSMEKLINHIIPTFSKSSNDAELIKKIPAFGKTTFEGINQAVEHGVTTALYSDYIMPITSSELGNLSYMPKMEQWLAKLTMETMKHRLADAEEYGFIQRTFNKIPFVGPVFNKTVDVFYKATIGLATGINAARLASERTWHFFTIGIKHFMRSFSEGYKLFRKESRELTSKGLGAMKAAGGGNVAGLDEYEKEKRLDVFRALLIGEVIAISHNIKKLTEHFIGVQNEEKKEKSSFGKFLLGILGVGVLGFSSIFGGLIKTSTEGSMGVFNSVILRLAQALDWLKNGIVAMLESFFKTPDVSVPKVSLGEWFSAKTEGIKIRFSGMVSSIGTYIDDIWRGMVSVFDSFMDGIRSIRNMSFETIKTSMKSMATSSLEKMKNFSFASKVQQASDVIPESSLGALDDAARAATRVDDGLIAANKITTATAGLQKYMGWITSYLDDMMAKIGAFIKPLATFAVRLGWLFVAVESISNTFTNLEQYFGDTSGDTAGVKARKTISTFLEEFAESTVKMFTFGIIELDFKGRLAKSFDGIFVTIGQMIADITDIWSQPIQNIKEQFKKWSAGEISFAEMDWKTMTTDILKSIGKTIGVLIGTMMGAIDMYIQNEFGGWGNFLWDLVSSAFSLIGKVVDGIFNFLLDSVGDAFELDLSAGKNPIEKIKSFLTDMFEAIANLVDNITRFVRKSYLYLKSKIPLLGLTKEEEMEYIKYEAADASKEMHASIEEMGFKKEGVKKGVQLGLEYLDKQYAKATTQADLDAITKQKELLIKKAKEYEESINPYMGEDEKIASKISSEITGKDFYTIQRKEEINDLFKKTTNLIEQAKNSSNEEEKKLAIAINDRKKEFSDLLPDNNGVMTAKRLYETTKKELEEARARLPEATKIEPIMDISPLFKDGISKAAQNTNPETLATATNAAIERTSASQRSAVFNQQNNVDASTVVSAPQTNMSFPMSQPIPSALNWGTYTNPYGMIGVPVGP